MSQDLELPAIDPMFADVSLGSSYPAAYRAPMQERVKRKLGPRLGLRQMGVNIVELPPSGWSSQRHWHSDEEEFIYVLQGEVWLVTDTGEQLLRSGTAAGFPAGIPDGHHLVNRSAEVAVIMEVGTRRPGDTITYPDVNLILETGPGGKNFKDVDGNPV